jgi:hypothetical protein
MREIVMSKSLAELTPEDFESHQNAEFKLGAADTEITLKLVKVSRLGAAVRKGGAFSLVFVSAPGPYLAQSIYQVSHPSIGTHPLFLVPIGPREDGNGYEAVFA